MEHENKKSIAELLMKLGAKETHNSDGSVSYSITFSKKRSDEDSLEGLREELEELEDQYDELLGDEPDDDTEAHEEWERKIDATETEISELEDKIDEME